MSANSRRILILDDDEEDLEILQDHLANCADLNCEVTALTSIEAAEEALAGEPFDAVFLDYRLQGRDKGTVLLDAIDRLPNEPRLILCSGNEESFLDQDAMQRMRSGQVRFLSKRSITPQELTDLVLGA